MTKIKKLLVYEALMSILALLAVALSIVDMTLGMNPTMTIIDMIILIIFIVDIIIRFMITNSKKTFLKDNVLDLIAVIPFSSAFKVFRIAKLAKLTRLTKITQVTKLSRLLAHALRFTNRIKSFIDTNGFKYILIITGVFIVLGAIGISQVENMSFVDGIWWAFVTATTVGYGDISPSTNLGRLIAGILMITGIGLIGSLTSTITSYFFTKSKKETLRDKIIKEIQEQIGDVDNLSHEDINRICNVLKALKDNQYTVDSR